MNRIWTISPKSTAHRTASARSSATDHAPRGKRSEKVFDDRAHTRRERRPHRSAWGHFARPREGRLLLAPRKEQGIRDLEGRRKGLRAFARRGIKKGFIEGENWFVARQRETGPIAPDRIILVADHGFTSSRRGPLCVLIRAATTPHRAYCASLTCLFHDAQFLTAFSNTP